MTDAAPTAPAMRAARPAATVFIIATVTIDAMGFGLVLPVIPSLLMDLTDSPVGVAARWGGIATFIFAIMQFVFSPILGGVSDRFGRRPVLLMSLAALSLDYLLMGLAHALWVFFIARILSGIFAATYSTANAYVADTSSGDARATRFGWLGAAMGAGFILGPAIGGLLGELTPRAPFYAAAGLAAVNALYGFFVIPESLKREKRRAFSWARANTVGTLLQLRRIDGLGVLVVVYLFSGLSSFVYPAVWSYVSIGKFGWSEAEIGASIAFYGLLFAISQAGMVPLLLPKLGVRRAIWISLAVEAAALVGIAFAPNGLTVYVLICTALITGLQGPALQKVMTERVGEDAQGELQGGLSALGGVTLVLAPLVYTQMFFAFERGLMGVRFPGAPFLLAAVLAGIALVLFLGRRHRTSTEPETS